MADKCIGKLTLDISQVKKDINEVNDWLGKIGANINLEDKLSKKISAALNNLVKEAKHAGEEAQKAISKGLSADVNVAVYEKMEQKVLATENKMRAEAEKTIAKQEERAEREAAAIERAEERKRAAREKQEAQYEQVWKRAEAERERVQAAEEARIEREVAKAEAAAEKKAAAEERAAERAAAAREKQEAAYQKVWDKAVFDQRQAELKQYQKDIEDYSKALTAMLNEQAKFNQQVASGKLVEGTEQYTQAEEKIRHLESAAISAGQKLDEAGRNSAMGMREVQTALDNVKVSMAAINDSGAPDYLKTVTDAYNRLRDAVNQYSLAKKAHNEQGMNIWQAEIDKQSSIINGIQQIISSLNVEEGVREQIRVKLEQAKTLVDGFEKGVVGTTNATNELSSQVNGLLTRYLSLMAVIRAISSLIQNTVEYVSEYSDKMNEIQMITMKTDEEVEKLAKTYRSLAADMSVSSLDMADAAIYFTRQGLGAEQIEKRLVNVTRYAKAANVEFKDASEIITAVVNSMGLVKQEAEDGREAAQRVADVFLNIGDNAATSGQEIGEAMQKAAASAGAFGVSMEWLASYIATVSETTRQEARTIGTAFNTIIARLHQIKQTGYNQEDETKVNDIAKALSKIDVVLMDQAGNWRDMETILEEIASKWGTLDGKTKSYIATTMAGVKQQNVFLALMNDMSKGFDEQGKRIEGFSRAYDLYDKAINSVGVAEQKYAVYLDTVTAAQERLTVAQERFYSILNEDVIKGWYDFLAGIVNMIADANEALGGVNLIIPVIVAGIVGITVAVNGLNAGLGTTITLSTILSKHPIMLAIGAAVATLGLLVGVISAVGQQIETTQEKFDRANDTLERSREKISEYKSLQSGMNEMFDELGDKVLDTSTDLKEYNDLLDALAVLSPTANKVVQELRDGMIDQKEAAEKLNAELDKLIGNEQQISMISLRDKYKNWKPTLANEGAADVLHNWNISDFNSTEELADKALARWTMTNDDLIRRGRWFTSDMQKYINEELSRLRDMDEGKWNVIAQGLWEKFFFGSEGSKGISEQIVEEADTMITDAVNTIAANMNMNELDKSFMQEYMKDILFGDDGELSFAEYEDAGNKISAFVERVIGHGFEIHQYDKLDYLGQQLFGNFFDMIFDEQIDQFMQQSDAQEAIDAIWDAVSELFAEGFSEQDIASLLESIPMSEWDQAVDKMANRLRESIMKNGKVDVLGLWDKDSKTGEETLSTMMWDDLDLGVLKLIDDMVTAGVALDDIQMAMSASRSVDEFVEKLHELSEENGIVTETTEEEVYSFKDLIKAANEGVKDIKALDAAIKTLENKEDIDYGDMLGLAEAHPELLTVIGDTEALLAALRNLRKEASEKQRSSLKDLILGDERAMAGSKYAGNGFNTLGEYRASISNQEDLDAFDAEVEAMLDRWQKANEDAKKVAKEAKEEAKEAEKTFNDTAKEIDTLDKAIKNVAKNGSLDMSELLNIAKSHPEIMMFVDDAGKMIEALKKLKKEAQDSTKTKLLTYMLDSEDFFKNSEYYNAEFKTMREYLNMLHDSAGGAGQWSEIWNAMQAAADAIVEGAEETEEAAKTWLEAQMEIVEANERANWAKSTGYVSQMGELQRALDSGDAKELLDTWESFDDKIKEGIADTYPDLVKSLYEVEKASKDIGESADGADKLNDRMQELVGTIDKMQRIQQAKYFKGTADALLKLEKGTISATDAYDVFYKECDKVTKASEEIADAQAKIASKTALEESDVNDLASLLGMTTDQVLNDFPGAVSVFNELIGAGGELRSMFELLNKEAFIRITGVSEADFSNITNGLLVIGDMAEETIKLLEATGQWKVETMELNGEASVFENGAIVQKDLSGYQQVLKPTGNNPYKGRSGGAGTTKDTNKTKTSSGGGGGGSKNKSDSGMTEVEKMLDIMSKIGDIQGAQQNWYQAQQKYYSQTGQLQGVIAYMQKEKESLEAQNGTLDGNIKRIEEYMNLKRAELESMSESDERYATVASDLDKLQKAHQNYTKQLIDNKTAIEALAEAMEEQRKKIRQMEIDVEEMIYKAIEDRERKAQDMLNAEIEMENKVLELIKRRYEKERDQIIETTNLKIDALKQERDLLDEQLRIRKEQAEEEDKMLKLQELEAKYQRIIADPTRAKEAQKIRTEIDELREEMAWDVAQKEVDAQKEAIDQQITSLEDYVEYVENYYEDLFEHPQKLIEEMRGIMQMTQEELIDWLKTNDEEYQKATENTQKSMVDGWTQTYNDMKGIVQTYWDEVHEIMARGDDYIINFLKQHSADYAKASRLQAEAYVDEWQKKLNDLRKAHQNVIAQIAADYKVIPTVSTSGTGTGGGGGGGGNPDGKAKYRYEATLTYIDTDYGYKIAKGKGESNTSEDEAKKDARTEAMNAARKTGRYRDSVSTTYAKYKKGGLASFTGPAWLDGTPQEPERILSPYQTQLFETMVQALERMSTISVPGMSNYSSLQSTGANPVSVGDIIVNVDNLDTDDDYEELAQKVGEVLMDRIGKTAVVGGLRIRSV